ncbi:MAG: trypsin-like peptidase domain-containing protein [bacterium]|nr:trypsin-like peptidase domain-containing protein [bacterium]
MLVVAAIFVFAPRSEQRALAVSENQGSGPSALNDDRFLFANLADQVIPSVVTVYVKRDLKRNMTPEELRQFEQFRRFFQGPDNPFQGSPFEFFFGPDQGQEPDQQDPGNENPHAPDGENNPFLQQASGSGVIISADGYIITNWHVVGDKDQGTSITVVFSDNSELDNNHVKLVESNRLLDLALLKVDRKGLKPIQWGDSDKLRIGERVACVGSPLDLRETVTQGIVCAMHRNVDIGIGDMIQTDAVINPGSSGGAMVNLEGQLVGINRLITSRTGWWQGYGFAIPANDVRYFTDQVIRTGHFTAGYIGIEMAPDENTGQ